MNTEKTYDGVHVMHMLFKVFNLLRILIKERLCNNELTGCGAGAA